MSCPECEGTGWACQPPRCSHPQHVMCPWCKGSGDHLNPADEPFCPSCGERLPHHGAPCCVARCAGRSAVAHAPALVVDGRCPVCGEEGWSPANQEAPMADCPNALHHTEGPTNYVGHFEWQREMAKTHRLTRCPDCVRFVIWTPKKEAT